METDNEARDRSDSYKIADAHTHLQFTTKAIIPIYLKDRFDNYLSSKYKYYGWESLELRKRDIGEGLMLYTRQTKNYDGTYSFID